MMADSKQQIDFQALGTVLGQRLPIIFNSLGVLCQELPLVIKFFTNQLAGLSDQVSGLHDELAGLRKQLRAS
jgi:hypothetical protein